MDLKKLSELPVRDVTFPVVRKTYFIKYYHCDKNKITFKVLKKNDTYLVTFT